MPTQGRVLLSEVAVAQLCGVHVATAGRWRRLGIGPPWQRRGRQVVYARSPCSSGGTAAVVHDLAWDAAATMRPDQTGY